MNKQISHYSYVDQVGSTDAFGVSVYWGKDMNNGQDVKIKMVNMAQVTLQGKQEVLDNEITILKELQGDGIVKWIDVFSNEESTVIVTEYSLGYNLRDDMNLKGGRYFEWQALAILRQLILGFKVMSQHGIVHRDIRPESCQNFETKFKLINFEKATHTDNNGTPLRKYSAGIPIYMSPQLLEQQAHTAKCDIWSFGIMAFEMVYGRPPWPFTDEQSYINDVKNVPLKFPYTYNSEISEQFNDFLKKSLIVDEHARIGWDELFQHPVFSGSDDFENLSKLQIEDKSRKLCQHIKNIPKSIGLIIESCFYDYDRNNDGFLDQFEFWDIIQMLDPKINSTEYALLFQYFDAYKTGKIRILHFLQCFREFEFLLKGEELTMQLILELNELAKFKKYDLEQLYDKYDTTFEGDLGINELTPLIKDLNSDLEAAHIELIINAFGVNNGQRINYQQFLKGMQLATNKEKELNSNKIKAQKLLQELKRVIKHKSMSLDELFMLIEQKNNKQLDHQEFQQLCKLLVNSPNKEVQDLTFKILDSNNNGVIEYEELQRLVL